MKNKKWMKITLLIVAGLLSITLLISMTVAYSMRQSVKNMYEPLPSIEWEQPSIPDAAEVTTNEETPKDEGDPIIAVVDDKVIAVKDEDEDTESNKFIDVSDEQIAQLRNPDLSKGDPFSILLLGVDERPGDNGRSDTLILLTVNPDKEQVLVISIPRDTRIQLPVSESADKINHAYAYGGTSRAVESVERLLGVPIAYYMKTNMEGLKKIVDTVGGVDVKNLYEFTHLGVEFKKGSLHLSGEEALAYIRMRKDDPTSDFGRTARQREVLTSAVDQLLSFRTLGKFPKLLSQMSESVRTNLKLDDMLLMAREYRSSIKQVETLYLQGKGATIKRIYYWIPDSEDRVRVQKKLFDLLHSS